MKYVDRETLKSEQTQTLLAIIYIEKEKLNFVSKYEKSNFKIRLELFWPSNILY